MITPVQAWKLIAAHARPLPAVDLALDQAAGLRLAADLRAAVAYPRFDNGALDGYALRSRDSVGASAKAPVALAVAGQQFAGQAWRGRLGRGQALHMTTGSPLPAGADALVPYELVERRQGAVLLSRPVREGANVRRRGEDVRRGEVLAQTGEALTPERLALAAACGLGRLRVRPRWSFSITVTGDELSPAGGHPGPGGIFDSNTPLLRALGERDGGRLALAQHLPDRRAALKRGLARALKSDLVLLAGGMSVGERDLVKDCLKELGVRRVFWRVAQKPGKPLYFGVKGRSLVFGLPGNPAAVQACYLAYVRSAIAGLQGQPAVPAFTRARLAQAIAGGWDKARYLKAELGDDGRVRALGGQGSHQLKSLAQGQALIYLPAGDRSFKAGATVKVLRHA